MSEPLLDYNSLLNDTSFLRVHKSFLVNLYHVKEYQRGEGGFVVMSNNSEIEVSVEAKEEFLTKIKEVSNTEDIICQGRLGAVRQL